MLHFVESTIEPAQNGIVERFTPSAVNCYVTIAPFAERWLYVAPGPFGLPLGKPCN